MDNISAMFTMRTEYQTINHRDKKTTLGRVYGTGVLIDTLLLQMSLETAESCLTVYMHEFFFINGANFCPVIEASNQIRLVPLIQYIECLLCPLWTVVILEWSKWVEYTYWIIRINLSNRTPFRRGLHPTAEKLCTWVSSILPKGETRGKQIRYKSTLSNFVYLYAIYACY